MKDIILGIDLGTTNSAVAYLKDGRPEIIPIDGQPTMPSCVGIDPTGRLVVGQAARNMLITSPESTVLSIKRKMGQDTKITLGDRSFSPEEISSFILSRLKNEAEKALGQPIGKAVITVPAFFDESQRKATQQAGELANLEVVRIINEPTAAALAYQAGHSSQERIIVYDLGGGTFDVSVVSVEDGVVEVLASHGDTHLGGDDFDDLLVQHVVSDFQKKHGIFLNNEPKTLRRLKIILERAKCQLSDEPYVKIREEYIYGDLHLELELSRLEYEAMISAYLQETLDCIHKSLQDAKLVSSGITKVMLVGGSTRTPLVQEIIEQNLHITPRWEINPDLIVALGASIAGASMAGEKIETILVDIASHTMGVQALIEDFGGLGYAPIIHRNTPLPASKTESFSTAQDSQAEVEVVVYQGESQDLDENTLIGKFTATGLSLVPAGNTILINFSLDLNGMLKVTATEKATGLSKAVVLDTRNARPTLDLDEARKNIQNLLEDSDFFSGHSEEATDDSDGDSDATDAASSIETANDLRKRAEVLVAKGIGSEDADEIKELLDKSVEAIQTKDIAALEALNETLSDILFYLED